MSALQIGAQVLAWSSVAGAVMGAAAAGRSIFVSKLVARRLVRSGFKVGDLVPSLTDLVDMTDELRAIAKIRRANGEVWILPLDASTIASRRANELVQRKITLAKRSAALHGLADETASGPLDRRALQHLLDELQSSVDTERIRLEANVAELAAARKVIDAHADADTTPLEILHLSGKFWPRGDDGEIIGLQALALDLAPPPANVPHVPSRAGAFIDGLGYTFSFGTMPLDPAPVLSIAESFAGARTELDSAALPPDCLVRSLINPH